MFTTNWPGHPIASGLLSMGLKILFQSFRYMDGSIEEIKTDLMDVSIYHFDWSPDGDRFVFAGFRGDNPEFWLLEEFLPEIKANF